MIATGLLAVPLTLPDTCGEGVPHLPGYELLGLLGRGSHGTVFRARQITLDRIVAVKVGRSGTRLRRTARFAAGLTHPHIAAVLDTGRASAGTFVVTEYVHGPDLGALIRDQGPLPPSLACACVRQAALALAHAHAHGVSHGDVKPGSLLLSSGAVSDVAPPATAPEWSVTTGHVALTVKVVGFELGSLVEQEDLSGLGCTLYYLLCGRMPFAGRSTHGEEPEPLRRLRPDISAEIAALAHRLLARRPVDRFQSAAHVAAALAPFSRGNTAAASVGNPDDRLSEAASPNGRVLRCSDKPVTCLAMSADGRWLATAGPEGTLHIWSLETEEKADSRNCPLERVLGMAFTGDAQLWVAGTHGARLAIWDAFSRRTIASWRRPGPVETLALGPHRALTGGADQYLRVWDIGARRATRIGGIVAERHWGPIRAVAMGPDGRCGLSGSDDGTARFWDLQTGHELRCLRGHAAPVVCVGFTPDGQRALTGAGRDLRLWNVESGELLSTLASHEGDVRCLAFMAHGAGAASGGDDGSVRLWDLEEGRELACFAGHLGPVLTLAFTPDGRHIISASTDRTVRVWPVCHSV
jgi:hypothetical protein